QIRVKLTEQIVEDTRVGLTEPRGQCAQGCEPNVRRLPWVLAQAQQRVVETRQVTSPHRRDRLVQDTIIGLFQASMYFGVPGSRQFLHSSLGHCLQQQKSDRERSGILMQTVCDKLLDDRLLAQGEQRRLQEV